MIITLSNIDPIAIQIGFIAIRWYSIAYILGILFVMFWIKKCNHNNQLMSTKAYDDWIFWAVLSIILGGRLGYVLFYNSSYFLKNPAQIFAIWQGGMSFHGGLCGAVVGMFLFTKKNNIQFFRLTDVLVVAAPIGLFFGRIANFINMELYGRVTQGNYGVIFPNAGILPRHPSQLYEACLEGLLTFIILFSLYQFSEIKKRVGVLSGIFLALYGIFRILIENFRQPDDQIGFIFGKITMGQILSFPLILFGITLIFIGLYKKPFELKA